jgi:hypothetical protein
MTGTMSKSCLRHRNSSSTRRRFGTPLSLMHTIQTLMAESVIHNKCPAPIAQSHSPAASKLQCWQHHCDVVPSHHNLHIHVLIMAL